jgi:hypothetical protein
MVLRKGAGFKLATVDFNFTKRHVEALGEDDRGALRALSRRGHNCML